MAITPTWKMVLNNIGLYIATLEALWQAVHCLLKAQGRTLPPTWTVVGCSDVLNWNLTLVLFACVGHMTRSLAWSRALCCSQLRNYAQQGPHPLVGQPGQMLPKARALPQGSIFNSGTAISLLF